jgi:hypothetical protein|tara:strand:+ start:273 stop:572 length:300 start_codon:yes stop_codon:yes gene_type:complete
MSGLNFCPFCGNDEEDEDGINIFSTHCKVQWTYASYVVCGHCGARGGNFIEETLAQAEERAADDWNQSGRPSWWEINVSNRWKNMLLSIDNWICEWTDR